MMGTMILYFFFLLKSNVFTFDEEGISISTHLLRPLLTHCESNDRVGVLSLLQIPLLRLCFMIVVLRNILSLACVLRENA
jgi:hypothetical protein